MPRTLLTDKITLTRNDGSSVTFSITEHIGSGASCVVYHAVCDDKTEHLLKEYYPVHLDIERSSEGTLVVPAHQKEDFEAGLTAFKNGSERQKDVRLSEKLKNFTSNIQGYYCGNGTAYIDMTCFNGRTYNNVGNESLYTLMVRMRTLTQVIGYYHNAGLLHLDIKPENIYVRPEEETAEDVMLFDFDSVVEIEKIKESSALSFTKTWAAPEQLLPYKRDSICKATDLFPIGEMIFTKIYGRHSTQSERRSFAKYQLDHEWEIFKNVNPRVFPLIQELFSHTICATPARRYQTADELMEQLDKIIPLADPKEPYLKSSLPAVQDFFVGREDEIEKIHCMLQDNRILFLHGIGGIGKSELAKHYAAEHRDDYDAIIFAPYVSDVTMLLQDDTAIPLYNFAQYPEEKPEEYCARKLRKLRELCDKRTLFIVDNLDREDYPDLNKLLDLDCKLLITTRMDFSDYGYGQQLYLDALRNRDSIREIFRKYYTKPLTEEESSCMEQIIDLVAGHTMTVELLAKQMMAGRVKPEKMLEKLQDGGISESGKEKVRSGKDGVLSAQSAYDHIRTLFDLFGLNEDERYILANLSLIPYTGISVELFHDLCDLKDYEGVNQLVVEGWVRLDKERDYISLHPLMTEIIRDSNDDSSVFEKFTKAYILHLRNRDSTDDVDYLKHKEDNLINIWLINVIERNEYCTPFFGVLLNEIGGKLYAIHRYDLALKACNLSTKISMECTSAKNYNYNIIESMAQTALIKATIGAEQNNPVIIKEAVNIYLESINNFNALGLNEYPNVYQEIATLYNYIAMAYEDLEEIDNARDMYNKGISIYIERTILTSDDYIANTASTRPSARSKLAT